MKTVLADIHSQRQRLEDCLQLINPRFTYRQENFESFLSEFGIDYFSDVHRGLFTVKAGSQVILSTTLDSANSYLPCFRHTNQLEQFKAWIGMPDALFQEGSLVFDRELPSEPWSSRHLTSATELTPREQEDLQKAGYAYLFGNSQLPLVASYQSILEKLHAPFAVAVWAIEKIRVEAGSSLVVQGKLPAALILGELEIVAGGNIQLCAPTHLMVQKLEKISL